MKRKLFLTLGLSLGFIISIISCGNKHTSLRSSAEPDVAYFCPMDTMINEAKAGHCNVCGMTLIKNPNYSGEEISNIVVTSTGDTLKK